jgi:cellulose synthase/poly-beta-1,6-N-acetylglucosamine synthase-like glycosyltransferase
MKESLVDWTEALPLRLRGRQIGLLTAVMGMWLLAFCLFLPFYLETSRNIEHPIIGAAAWITIVWLNVSSLFAFYHAVSFLGSLLVRAVRAKATLADLSKGRPAVAVLYPCMNDFDERAFQSCVDLDYDNFLVFILDDSTDTKEMERSDSAQRRHPDLVRVIRRVERAGFKAGNLNHCIAKLGHSFKYYCVTDSDERLPRDFLNRCVSIAEADQGLAFVQAAHRTYARTRTGELLGAGLRTHWDYFLPIRNYSGFQYFIGHGALIRASALQAVNGFRHVVAEDIDLAARMRMAGFKGYFDLETECLEAIPDNYQAFCVRGKKIMTGTLEFLARGFPDLLRCRNVSLGEKVDVLMAAGVVLLPVAFVAIIILLFAVLPALYILCGGTVQQYRTVLPATMAPLNHLSFELFALFTMLAPASYALPDMVVRRFRRFSGMLQLGASHLSICMPLAASAFSWACTRRSEFVATGDRTRAPARKQWTRLIPAGCCLVVGVVMGSTSLIAMGIAALLVPLLHRYRPSRALMSTLSCLVYAMAISASFVDSVAAAVGVGMCCSLALLHQ